MDKENQTYVLEIQKLNKAVKRRNAKIERLNRKISELRCALSEADFYMTNKDKKYGL